MATAAESSNKTTAALASAPARSRRRLLLAIVVLLLLTAAAIGVGWWLSTRAAPPATTRSAPPAPPVFVELDTFTVNLAGEHLLQTTLSLQVAQSADADQLKLYLPQVKHRLLLLSAKTAEELQSTVGKEQLRTEIAAHLRSPYASGLAAPVISGVFLTSFVIE